MWKFPIYLLEESKNELIQIVNKLLEPGKGILAADDIGESVSRRLRDANLSNIQEYRRLYRQLLVEIDNEFANYISGLILYHESFYHKSDSRVMFPKLIQQRGILPGIRLDKNTIMLDQYPTETTTQGLDGLAERCRQYYEDGARFGKWRCVYHIKANCPSYQALSYNSNVIARSASITQQNGLVPILEVDIAQEGNHDYETAQQVTQQVLSSVFLALQLNHVCLEAILLKINIVIQGLDCKVKPTVDEMAKATVTTLRNTVPPAVPGICFGSGTLSEVDATTCLNTMNKMEEKKPWILTFGFGRSLQASMLKKWGGKKENVEDAQKILINVAKANSAAVLGKYDDSLLAGDSTELVESRYH